ncbi:hypothetical protein C2S53_010556 [Perilla frutescens var. hirtella]|uniref:PGG domain-containing protein n=1 Tax=Perilla frutescens var. hirtella TaxID=608512 RepID=A0AAD4IML9_PERFH|nr:hypothetical protein C2S53_010556 [Perilla frutescens var. hirtella]
MYSPKWVEFNDNNSSESQNDHGALHSVAQVSDGAATETNDVVGNQDQTQTHEVAHVSEAAVTGTNIPGNQDRTPNGINRRGNRLSNRHEAMYRAALEGDCVAAEMLLGKHPNLGSDVISEEGDRALHVAASMKHKDFVLILLERMTPSELEMVDGRGYTACCYAAMSGSIEIADLMIEENPTLAAARDRENKTPLQKAALRGNTNMVSYLLKSTKIEHLSKDEWFDLLLVTIRRKMYGLTLEILGSDEQLATMRNDEGTALHLLARQRFFVYDWQMINGVMREDMRLLAKKLLAGIETLGNDCVIELMKNHSILHDAAEEGNMELITLLTHAYPNLACHTNNKGHTIFHIAANYRHFHLFGLINEIGTRKDLIATSKDEDGNNILHLAAELAPPNRRWFMPMTTFHMRVQVLWFHKVKATVPPLCWEMRNKDGHTPAELFCKRHESLLEESKIWIRDTSASCMLISTLIFSVVFASTFAVPGGYNQETGIPVLYKMNWLTCFLISEALAMFSSAFCIVCFLRIMMLGYGEIGFWNYLPIWFVWGINGLTFSVFGAISAFVSAYFLVYAKERRALVESVILFLYVVIIVVACIQIYVFRMSLPEHWLQKQTRHTLFKRPHAVTSKRHWCWIL